MVTRLKQHRIETLKAHAKKTEPCNPGEHDEEIVHPDVSPDETDPEDRLNKMQQVAQESGDPGDQFEVDAARHNIDSKTITEGRQLSRKLLETEMEDGRKGDEQQIRAVCRICGADREVDQAPSNGAVEAKDRRTGGGQADQYANNAKLQKDGKAVTYKLPEGQARGQRGRAVAEAFRRNGARPPTIIGIS